MCGIIGAFSPDRFAAALRVDRLAHRGPDSSGEWRSSNGDVWLGHTRLAIIDLSSAGAQPMVDPESGNVIVFNGEIYNHLSIRRMLNLPDETWRGHSDTETILVGYREWGRAILERLKGMFALAIYDAQEHALWLARDRFGIKPLFYRIDGRNVVFSSEIRAINGDHANRISPAGVAHYFTWGACLDDTLVWEDWKTVPAGSWMEFSAHGSQTVGQYWPPLRITAEPAINAVRRIRELLESAIEEHLLADVPVACFLSGGIDSSVIAGLAATRTGRGLKTYTVGFPDTEFDESSVADIVARRFGTEHHLIRLTEENCLLWVHEALAALDLPSIDAINTFIVAKAVAAEGIKVALSGLGADELFGGYPSFRDVPRLMWLARLPLRVRRSLGALGRKFSRLGDLPGPEAVALAHWRREFFTAEQIAQLGLRRTEPRFQPCPGGLDTFAQISWAELTGYMRHMLLRDTDNMSMAVSLELRVPFLDHMLVEYVLALPQSEKRGYGRPKGLLIEACRDLLPPEVYQRPKMGFSLPMDRWMRGPLANLCDQGVARLLAANIVSEQAVESLRRRFNAGELHWTRWWSFVVLGHYLARFHSASGYAFPSVDA